MTAICKRAVFQIYWTLLPPPSPGYRKDDVEAALRSCGCRLDDALEMLAHRGMPQVRQMGPPDHPYAAPGEQPDGGRSWMAC